MSYVRGRLCSALTLIGCFYTDNSKFPRENGPLPPTGASAEVVRLKSHSTLPYVIGYILTPLVASSAPRSIAALYPAKLTRRTRRRGGKS